MLIPTWINDQNKIGLFFVQKVIDRGRVRTRSSSDSFCTKNGPILFWSFIHVGISIRHDLFFNQIPRAEFYKYRIMVFSKMCFSVDKKFIFWKAILVFDGEQKIDNKSKIRFHKSCYWRYEQSTYHFTFSNFLATHFGPDVQGCIFLIKNLS